MAARASPHASPRASILHPPRTNFVVDNRLLSARPSPRQKQVESSVPSRARSRVGRRPSPSRGHVRAERRTPRVRPAEFVRRVRAESEGRWDGGDKMPHRGAEAASPTPSASSVPARTPPIRWDFRMFPFKSLSFIGAWAHDSIWTLSIQFFVDRERRFADGRILRKLAAKPLRRHGFVRLMSRNVRNVWSFVVYFSNHRLDTRRWPPHA